MGRPVTPSEARRASRVGWAYRPANTRADLVPEADALGRHSMQEFLLSDQMRDPVLAATEDIRQAARALTLAIGAVKSGDFYESFDVDEQAPPMEIAGNLRVVGRVVNTSRHAAAEEFGNANRPGHRILHDAAQPWHSPLGPE